jgi:hypothetical protein
MLRQSIIYLPIGYDPTTGYRTLFIGAVKTYLMVGNLEQGELGSHGFAGHRLDIQQALIPGNAFFDVVHEEEDLPDALEQAA